MDVLDGVLHDLGDFMSAQHDEFSILHVVKSIVNPLLENKNSRRITRQKIICFVFSFIFVRLRYKTAGIISKFPQRKKIKNGERIRTPFLSFGAVANLSLPDAVDLFRDAYHPLSHGRVLQTFVGKYGVLPFAPR